ncbi:vWA domain-containing protein [Simplicispira psychrophila]|uniref:vWA domain-containing protein n=1 Tax=Simplicispira psychrophila TaxID=80882 RepID=UPI000AE6CA8D|nr:VWA domain-containing protein [Simplicispira psychrophila]
MDSLATPATGDAGAAEAGAIAWLPTLRAKGAQALQHEHLRRLPLPAHHARLHCIVLDTSGSMRAQGRLALAKGHAAQLIAQAAQQGDDVALLQLGGDGVQLLLAPGRARASGSWCLRAVGGGGGTPLAQALAQAEQLLQRALRRQGPLDCWLWLLTDGRTLEQLQPPPSAQHRVILDFDDPRQPLGRCAAWAVHWGASHYHALSVP